MMKTRPVVIASLLLAGSLLLPASALAGKRPNPNRGKSQFKATCKICHVKGGEAPNLTPMTKTQAQWKRFFGNGKKIAACVERSEKRTQIKLGEEELRNMSYYLIKHAADSDQPETCGQ